MLVLSVSRCSAAWPLEAHCDFKTDKFAIVVFHYAGCIDQIVPILTDFEFCPQPRVRLPTKANTQSTETLDIISKCIISAGKCLAVKMKTFIVAGGSDFTVTQNQIPSAGNL